MQLKYNLLKIPILLFTQVRSPFYSNGIQYVAIQVELAAWSSGYSAVLINNMISVQTPLAPFCCVLKRDTLRHFPCLVVLASSSKLQSYLY